jgi:hypothetical protein
MKVSPFHMTVSEAIIDPISVRYEYYWKDWVKSWNEFSILL